MALPAVTVTGQMIDATYMNIMRDALNSLDQHSHGGGVLDGEQFLSSLDRIDLDYQSGLDAPASGHLRFWADSGGTLRWRAFGGSEKTASESGHSH